LIYYAVIILLMAVLPAASMVIEQLAAGGAVQWLTLVGKWFVFWAVGIRLLLAGLRQIVRPALTADLLKISDTGALVLVRELGFWNIAGGLIAALSLPFATWTTPAAVAGMVFYLLAGVQHATVRHRGTDENWAMYSDLWAFVVLALYVGLSLLQR
jgi:hypothetical protein